MNILAVADVASRHLYDFYTPGKLDDYDLILACGDLSVPYLEFLVTMARCPLLYVHGNHDEDFQREPEGCVCIDDTIYDYKGLRIMGLGGSYRYRDGCYMYTERQMRRRIERLRFSLWRHRGIDILVTHAPARHVNDFDSLSHRGFQCFADLMDRYRPRYFVHGHIHKSYGSINPRRCTYGETTVINAWEYCCFEI
ncbi:MAG: metallophosphoesterase family protein [Firmicutes bacterium]|nr:metallophosphoesterase family protein [Bacillota bacterium]